MFNKKNENSELSDEKLFQMMQQGNRLAFNQIYNRYSRMLYGIALRYLKNEAIVQDAVQYVFIKFWECHKNIIITTSLRNYLYTMMRNYMLNQIRGNKKEQLIKNYQEAQQNQPAIESIVETIEKEEVLAALYRALNLLPNTKKEVCMLKMKGQMTNQQIAETLGVSVSTVKKHYTQAKAILKQHLKKVFIFITFIISS